MVIDVRTFSVDRKVTMEIYVCQSSNSLDYIVLYLQMM